MARLNLLPWRDERRAEQRRVFLLALAAAAGLGVALVLAADRALNARIDSQLRRNAYLEQHTRVLDAQVETIGKLRRQRAVLLERSDVVRGWQGERALVARVLDELARAVPEGVFYTELRARGGNIAIAGVAASSGLVSGLMRRLGASEWFASPSLEGVRAAPELGGRTIRFNLTVRLQPPPEPQPQLQPQGEAPIPVQADTEVAPQPQPQLQPQGEAPIPVQVDAEVAPQPQPQLQPQGDAPTPVQADTEAAPQPQSQPQGDAPR